jgi:hypothetical protein
MEWDEDKEKHKGSTVLVPFPTQTKPNEGQLLREMGYAEKAPVAGRYIMGSDGALTLITDYETMYSEERLWFASPNLRYAPASSSALAALAWLLFPQKFAWVSPKQRKKQKILLLTCTAAYKAPAAVLSSTPPDRCVVMFIACNIGAFSKPWG